MWEDFKKFAFQGNVLDLAVGVMIGTAFGKNRYITCGKYYYAINWNLIRWC